MDSHELPRILLLAPNWLGDVVMTTPLLDLLSGGVASQSERRCRVTLGIRRRWAPLFDNDGRLDGLLPIHRQGRHHGVSGLWHLASDLGRGDWDGVVITPPSLRAALACALAHLPHRVGYAADGRSLLLHEAVPRVPRGRLHYSREMLQLGARLLERLGRGGDDVKRLLADPPAPRLDVPPVSGAGDTGALGPYWVVAPGTTYGEAKTWPVERVAQFLTRAVGERDAEVVLLGDRTTASFVTELRGRTQLNWAEQRTGAPGVVDLIGRTDLDQAVALLRGAEVFVGNDSGLMHVAAALGVVTVGVFGSSSPDWTAPLGPRADVVVAEGFDCRPCFRRTCNQPRFCLDTVDAEMVLATVTRLQQRSLAEES